jgi:hypothetical protein
MRHQRAAALIGCFFALAIAAASFAWAQSAWMSPDAQRAIPGAVASCLDISGNAVPCSSVTPLPVTVTSQSSGGFPAGSTAITGNATGTTGAVTGTLTSASGQTAYICGFAVSALGGTATVGPITIANTLTANMVYQFASSAAGQTLTQTFTPCIPASATNTNITVTTTADGTATAVDVNSWGFRIAATPYPFTVITGNSTGTTGAVTGTLAGTSGKTTYICGFSVAAIGGTATIGPVTVANTVGSSLVYQGSSSATGVTPISQTFSPCIPANATNTAITVATTADASATAVDVNAWGYQQ